MIDDGHGLDDGAEGSQGGLALVILRRRAEKLNGRFAAMTPETRGTRVIWEVAVTPQLIRSNRTDDVKVEMDRLALSLFGWIANHWIGWWIPEP
jgi:hypothetical protein